MRLGTTICSVLFVAGLSFFGICAKLSELNTAFQKLINKMPKKPKISKATGKVSNLAEKKHDAADLRQDATGFGQDATPSPERMSPETWSKRLLLAVGGFCLVSLGAATFFGFFRVFGQENNTAPSQAEWLLSFVMLAMFAIIPIGIGAYLIFKNMVGK